MQIDIVTCFYAHWQTIRRAVNTSQPNATCSKALRLIAAKMAVSAGSIEEDLDVVEYLGAHKTMGFVNSLMYTFPLEADEE